MLKLKKLGTNLTYNNPQANINCITSSGINYSINSLQENLSKNYSNKFILRAGNHHPTEVCVIEKGKKQVYQLENYASLLRYQYITFQDQNLSAPQLLKELEEILTSTEVHDVSLYPTPSLYFQFLAKNKEFFKNKTYNTPNAYKEIPALLDKITIIYTNRYYYGTDLPNKLIYSGTPIEFMYSNNRSKSLDLNCSYYSNWERLSFKFMVCPKEKANVFINYSSYETVNLRFDSDTQLNKAFEDISKLLGGPNTKPSTKKRCIVKVDTSKTPVTYWGYGGKQGKSRTSFFEKINKEFFDSKYILVSTHRSHSNHLTIDKFWEQNITKLGDDYKLEPGFTILDFKKCLAMKKSLSKVKLDHWKSPTLMDSYISDLSSIVDSKLNSLNKYFTPSAEVTKNLFSDEIKSPPVLSKLKSTYSAINKLTFDDIIKLLKEKKDASNIQ